MVLERECTEFQIGEKTSYYRLSYQDGKKEYFDSSGRLMGIQNRFGNTISFSYDPQRGSIITDSLGRTILVSGEYSDSGHTIFTLILPRLHIRQWRRVFIHMRQLSAIWVSVA